MMHVWLETLKPWLDAHTIWRDAFWLSLMALAGSVLHQILKRVVLIWVRSLARKMAARTRTSLDDHLIKHTQFERVGLVAFGLIFWMGSHLLVHLRVGVQRVAMLLMFWILVRIAHGFLKGLAAYTEDEPRFHGKPYKGYIQVVILLLYVAAALVGMGILTGQSPWVLLSGIGALTAVLLLVFRETILSLVASLQISSYDLVRRGDWISVPKYEADGDVMDIALHTIKIQNWDKTISVIPTHALVESGFRNWRGMQEAGGRRIKRSLYLDQATVRFLDKTMLARLRRIELLTPYLDDRFRELGPEAFEEEGEGFSPVNGRRLTNLGTFRVYVERYLRSLPDLRQDLTFLVRQLDPGPTGIPLELYVFTATTQWGAYEAIQADIFDHLLASARAFGLKVFQYPAHAEQMPWGQQP